MSKLFDTQILFPYLNLYLIPVEQSLLVGQEDEGLVRIFFVC